MPTSQATDSGNAVLSLTSYTLDELALLTDFLPRGQKLQEAHAARTRGLRRPQGRGEQR